MVTDDTKWYKFNGECKYIIPEHKVEKKNVGRLLNYGIYCIVLPILLNAYKCTSIGEGRAIIFRRGT